MLSLFYLDEEILSLAAKAHDLIYYFLEKSPLVSVIIPTFNRCLHLKETLASILQQSHTNFEVVIVSDNSSDDTASMIYELGNAKCKLYQLSNKSNGPSFVRNFGIKQSKGSLIAFCDDDDLWDVDKLKKQVAKFESDPELCLVATNVNYFGDVNRKFLIFSKIKNLINYLSIIRPKYILAFYNCLVISSTLVRKSVIEKYMFNETDKFQGHEDLDLWLKICNNEKTFILKESLTFYRIHANQLSSYTNSNYKRNSLEILKTHRSNFDALQNLICAFRILIYKIMRY